MPTAHAINTNGAGGDRTCPTGAGSGPTHACTGDVDGDGDLDVVVVCPGNATLWVGLNDGGGTLVGTSLSCPSAPINAWLGDIDDDGRCDLTVHCTDNTVRIFEVGAPASDDLFISTPVTIAPGTYRNVTILEGGVAMTAPGTSITVTGTYKTCASGNHIANANLLGNAARFRVQPGGELHIASPDGIVASGNGGSVPCAGCVPDWLSLAANATYVYDCPTPQVTGTGLPPAVADLLLGNDATQLTLTSPVTVLPAGKMSFQDFSFSLPVRARLISGGKLTLASSAAGTALLDVARIEVVGNLTVQTYLVPKPGGGGYRHFSPPVSTTYGDLATAGLTLVVNPLYNAAPVPGNIRPFPNVFGFDERRSPASGDFLTGYYSPDALISPWPVGRGATVYAPGNITCDFSGLVPVGDVDITGLTRTGAFGGNTEKSGWHMLGNMFPNLLDWDLVTIPAGISGSVSVYESTGGNNGRYLTRTNGLGSLEDGLIAPSQGFFCRVVDPTPPIGGLTLKIKLSDCPPPKENHSKHVTLNKRDAPDLRPRLTLALRDVRAAADEQDVATVYFQAGATAGLDDAFDGARPGRNIGLPTLATLAGPANELAINGLPETALTQPTTLELLLVLPTAGAHELAVRELAHLTNVSVELLDRLTGARYDLATTARLAFSSALAGEVRGRFALLFNGGRPTGLAADAAPSALVLWPNPAGGAVGVQLAGANPNTAVALLDATGRTVRRAQTDHFGNAALPVGGLVPGIYTVRTGAQTQRLLVD